MPVEKNGLIKGFQQSTLVLVVRKAKQDILRVSICGMWTNS